MKMWEAIKSLEEGKKVRVVDWDENWFLYIDSHGYIVDEEGYCPAFNIKWQEWEIYNERKDA